MVLIIAKTKELLVNAIKKARISNDPMETEILIKFGEESGCFFLPEAMEVFLEYALKIFR